MNIERNELMRMECSPLRPENDRYRLAAYGGKDAVLQRNEDRRFGL